MAVKIEKIIAATKQIPVSLGPAVCIGLLNPVKSYLAYLG